MIGVTAFHTDFLQSHVCGCKITAGGVDSLSSDIVTDTHALFLFKEGTQISRADIGFAGDIVQAQSIAGIVFVNKYMKLQIRIISGDNHSEKNPVSGREGGRVR